MSPAIDNTLALIAALRERGEAFSVVTVVRTANATSAKAGAKAVVLGDGTIRGFVGGGCVEAAVRRGAAAALKEGAPRLIRIKPKDEVVAPVDVDGTELHRSFCPSGGTLDLFIEPMRRDPRLVIAGASPVAAALALLAPPLGYRLALAALPEDHPAFAGVAERVEGFDLGPLGITAEDWIVVATQGRRDREALAAALQSAAAYVAFVGSRRKAETLRAQLRAQGCDDEQLARLKAPAGLDIHAIEPAEIALSILAEIVERRRSALGRSDSARAFREGAAVP
jgi:xanthine dehydrogenase accessory factor